MSNAVNSPPVVFAELTGMLMVVSRL